MEHSDGPGADVVMPFDQCPPYGPAKPKVAVACRRTRTGVERLRVVQTTVADQALFASSRARLLSQLRDNPPGRGAMRPAAASRSAGQRR